MEKSPQEEQAPSYKETRKHVGLQRVRSRMKTDPQIFGFDDMAQQIIGASLLSSPFCATEEIWHLANAFSPIRLGIVMALSVFLGVVMIYFTDYQRVADYKRFGSYVPVRIISLVCVSYGMVIVILSVLGVFEYGISLGFERIWKLKVVILVGFFAMLGGAVADVIH